MEEEIKTKVISPANKDHDDIVVVDLPDASTLSDEQLEDRIAYSQEQMGSVLHPDFKEIELQHNIPGHVIKFDTRGIEHGFELWYYYSDLYKEAIAEKEKRNNLNNS